MTWLWIFAIVYDVQGKLFFSYFTAHPATLTIVKTPAFVHDIYEMD